MITTTLDFWKTVYEDYRTSKELFVCFASPDFESLWNHNQEFKTECLRLKELFLSDYEGDTSFLIPDKYDSVLFNDAQGGNQKPGRQIRIDFLEWVIMKWEEIYEYFNKPSQ